MKRLCLLLFCCLLSVPVFSQDPTTWLNTLPHAKDYVQHRSSSYDRSGGTMTGAPSLPERHSR